MKFIFKLTVLCSICILISCTEHVAPENKSPEFNHTSMFNDTIYAWTSLKETLSVSNDDDYVSYRLSDTTTPFSISDSILSISPKLSDTGSYNLFVTATDTKGQSDTIHISAFVSLEYKTSNKMRRITRSNPQRPLCYTGDNYIQGHNGPELFLREYNKFGYTEKKEVVQNGTYYFNRSFSYEYDSLHYPTKVSSHNSAGDIISIANYFYNTDQNLIKVISANSDGSENGNNYYFEYANSGKLISLKYTTPKYIYDKDGTGTLKAINNLISYEYNNKNLLTKSTVMYDDEIFVDSTVYRYNSSNQLIETKEYNSSSELTKSLHSYNSAGQKFESIRYDDTGNIITKKETNYNAMGLISVISDYCWNDSYYSLEDNFEYEWMAVDIIKTPANDQPVINDPSNRVVTQETMEKLYKAGRSDIAEIFELSRH